MRNKVFLIGVIALVAYIVGSQASKAKNKNYEDLRHQVERLWTDPKARKARERARKDFAKRSRQLAKKTSKKVRAASS